MGRKDHDQHIKAKPSELKWWPRKKHEIRRSVREHPVKFAGKGLVALGIATTALVSAAGEILNDTYTVEIPPGNQKVVLLAGEQDSDVSSSNEAWYQNIGPLGGFGIDWGTNEVPDLPQNDIIFPGTPTVDQTPPPATPVTP